MNQGADASDSNGLRGVPTAPRYQWSAGRKEALVSFTLAAVFVIFYVLLHSEFRDNYLHHIRANIANSVMMYGIQAHEQTGELVLSLADKPFSMADAEPGPLGIGDLAATRGWLIQSSNVVETYNARLKAYVERLLEQFDFSRNRPNFIVADLSSIVPRWHQNQPKTCSTPEGSKDAEQRLNESKDCVRIHRMRVPRESIYDIWHQFPNERTAETLAAAIRGSTIEIVETRRPAQPHTDKNAAKKIADEVCDNLRQLQSGVRTLFGRFRPMSTIEHRPSNDQAVQPSSAPILPAAATSTPAADTSTPAAATSTPAAATSTPAADTSTPAAATSTPAAATSTPAADTSTPAAATSTPAAATSTPAADTSTPAAATSTPAADTSTPAADTSTPAADTSTVGADRARNFFTCEDFQPFLVSPVVVRDEAPRRPSDQLSKIDDEQDNVDCRSSSFDSLFHCRLAKIVRDNTGFFWTAGKFLWFEIVLLSLLGLVISRLVHLCKQYMSDEPFVWEDRGLWQTLLMIPATPIIALVIVWILSITNLLSIKPVLGHTWTSGIVPIAFLLGLFPHLGYDILQGLAKGVFNRPLRGWQAPTRDVVQRPIPDPDGPQSDERPSLDRLAAIIRQRFTAPFR